MRRFCAVRTLLEAARSRQVHEQPYDPTVHRLAPSKPGHVTPALMAERQQIAHDSLLQLHMMLHHGIQPDALMYTVLIDHMARARLEWQAYKLFSRMLEQNVTPLPETYVALRAATSPARRQLLQDIEAKIAGSAEALPAKLAEVQQRIRDEEALFADKKFAEYFADDLPPLAAQTSAGASNNRSTAPEDPTSPAPSGAASNDDVSAQQEHEAAAPRASGSKTTPRGTVVVKHPMDVWTSHKVLEEMSSERDGLSGAVTGERSESRSELAERLSKLHDEELRIFLAEHRQLRHGGQEELVERVLSSVPAVDIKKMLQRRQKYFRSVEMLLEDQMRAREEAGHLRDEEAERPSTDVDPAPAQELTPHNTEELAQDVLFAPWGPLRKPPQNRSAATQPSAAAGRVPLMSKRALRKQLTAEEQQQLHRMAHLGELDAAPLSLLRRYAFQHRLRWQRKFPGSLLAAVSWHTKTFPPGSNGQAVGGPTLAARREVPEREMALKTLDNFEAFRVIAQRTQNLQVVDSKEGNLHAQHLSRLSKVKDRKADEALRRQRNIAEADAIRSAAKHYTSRERRDAEVSRVLGFGPGSEPAPPPELPPWAIRDAPEPFNLRTGRFGEEGLTRYQELSDGRIQLQPVHAAEQQYHVDPATLPEAQQHELRRLELTESSAREEAEKLQSQKRLARRYSMFEQLIARNKAKSEKERSEKVKPLPPPRRMSMKLRAER
jgi:hypothetical protein